VTLDSEFQALNLVPVLSVAPDERSRGRLQPCRDVIDLVLKLLVPDFVVRLKVLELFGRGCVGSLVLRDLHLLELIEFDILRIFIVSVLEVSIGSCESPNS
jgi:hypothetical protein